MIKKEFSGNRGLRYMRSIDKPKESQRYHSDEHKSLSTKRLLTGEGDARHRSGSGPLSLDQIQARQRHENSTDTSKIRNSQQYGIGKFLVPTHESPPPSYE